MKVIIYIQDNGIPAVVVPVQLYVDRYGINAVAIKDVPEGKPFRIMDAADLPEGPQETWVIDPATLTDGVGGVENTFPSDGGEVESEDFGGFSARNLVCVHGPVHIGEAEILPHSAL